MKKIATKQKRRAFQNTPLLLYSIERRLHTPDASLIRRSLMDTFSIHQSAAHSMRLSVTRQY